MLQGTLNYGSDSTGDIIRNIIQICIFYTFHIFAGEEYAGLRGVIIIIIIIIIMIMMIFLILMLYTYTADVGIVAVIADILGHSIINIFLI